MGLFDKLYFTFNKEKITSEAIEKLNSYIDESKYSKTNYSKILILLNEYRSKISNAKNSEIIDDLLREFKKKVELIETIYQEEARKKAEEERIRLETLKRQRELEEQQKRAEEARKKAEEEKKRKAELKAKKEEEKRQREIAEAKRLAELERERLVKARVEFEELIELCDNVLKFIDFIEIDIEKLHFTISMSSAFTRAFGGNPIDSLRVIPGLDVCESLDLIVLIGNMDYISKLNPNEDIKRHIHERKRDYKFSDKTWDFYNKMKKIFLMHGYDVTKIRRNNKKTQIDYLSKKYGVDQSLWRDDPIPKLPDGWMWLSELGDEKIEESDEYIFYDEGQEDVEDYINTYAELYSRHLNGEYFYPDEDYDDVINLPIIKKIENEQKDLEAKWRKQQEDRERRERLYWESFEKDPFGELDDDPFLFEDDDDDIF